MSHHWDEFTKSLAEDAVPRRQSLRLLGAAIAGAVFSPLGSAWGAGADPCKTFCNQCSNKTQRNQCITACRECSGTTSRLAGACGRFVCCTTAACSGACSELQSDPNCGACGNDCGANEESCCGNYCADLENDFDNCGSCGFRCPAPAPYEFGECIGGACLYACVAGAENCNGVCRSLDSDPNNCGECGKVCGGPTPYCQQGTCFSCQPHCPERWCGGDGCGGTCGCPASGYCDESTNYCYDDGCAGADLLFDANNCGACGHACQPLEFCSWGVCDSAGGGE